MNKRVRRSSWRSSLILIFCMIFMTCLTGCGENASDSNSSGGTTAPAMLATLSVSSPAVAAGQTSVITANVTDGNSNPMRGETVTFTLPVNESGARFVNAAGAYVSSVSVNTDAGGNAVAIYLAGSNDSLLVVYDTVRAVLAEGASNAVVITRSAGTAPPPTTDLSVTLAAAPDSVSAGQMSIIQATVTGDNKSGAAVTFSLPVNASGASFINAGGSSVASITVTASGSGIATAIYKAGSASPDAAVQDTVQAVLTNGANGAFILTRTSTATSYYAVAITASATSVTAGQVSIITAKVTSTSGSTTTDAAGVSVSFTLPVNSSGATLSAATATTDGSGKAVVTYQPGTTSPTLSVSDTVQAAVGSMSSTAAIMRTGTAPLAYNLTISAAPATLSVTLGNSVITANLKDTNGTAVSGEAITFTCSRGTLSSASVTTGGIGNAVTTYTGIAPAGTAVVTATWGTYTNSVIINIP